MEPMQERQYWGCKNAFTNKKCTENPKGIKYMHNVFNLIFINITLFLIYEKKLTLTSPGCLSGVSCFVSLYVIAWFRIRSNHTSSNFDLFLKDKEY